MTRRERNRVGMVDPDGGAQAHDVGEGLDVGLREMDLVPVAGRKAEADPQLLQLAHVEAREVGHLLRGVLRWILYGDEVDREQV